jgi:hypothetical protein
MRSEIATTFFLFAGNIYIAGLRAVLQKFQRMELAREAAVEFQAQPA